MLSFGVITLFPQMFMALQYGITGRALKQGRIGFNSWNPRDYSADHKHRTVDDRPYGGGPGMVMMVQPLRDAIYTAQQTLGEHAPVIYLSPQGKRFDQGAAQYFAQASALILVAGRYEGIDQRLLETVITEQWSIGDYVLSGGEIAAMVMIDAITRLLPGALGDECSSEQDSFTQGLLDYPHYTRPEMIDGKLVPKVLLSGDHQAIARWRLKQALGNTWLQRPDLLAVKTLSAEEKILLTEFQQEYVRREA